MIPLQSCDILLCSGNSSTSKKIIWWQDLVGASKEAAQLSHAALYADIKRVFESTTMNKWADKSGVQTNGFDEWLRNYDGKVWARRLDFERTFTFEYKFEQFMDYYIGRKYENGIAGYLELFLAGCRLDRFIRKVWPSYRPIATKAPHCSELDVRALIELLLCSGKAIASRLPPYTFWPGGDFEKYLLVPIGKLERLK